MDSLKLDKWRKEFMAEVQKLQIEFDAFFLAKELNEFYQLRVDETSQNLYLKITHKEMLPKEIEKRLIEILSTTQPEDSV